MAYTAEISRSNPTCFLFMIDQSGSMKDPLPDGKTKAEYVADKLNTTLTETLGRCTKADGVRHYFDVGVIAYGNDQVRPGFGGALAGEYVCPISTLAERALRLENRVERIVGPGGDTREKRSSFQVWFEPTCAGSTPMRAAFERACRLLQEWCDEHPSSYPPTVLHVSDGNSTDGDPEEMASFLTRLGTDDGECLLYNRISTDRTSYAVRCFQNADERRLTRYDAISRFIEERRREDRDSVWATCELQPTGLEVNGQRYPMVKMEWVKGETPAQLLESRHHDRAALVELRRRLAGLAAVLEVLGVAHGDIQNSNILWTDDGLRLVDYDGMFLPGMEGTESGELGHPHFQHPGYAATHFGPTLDRFPFLVYDLSLRALEASSAHRRRTSRDPRRWFER